MKSKAIKFIFKKLDVYFIFNSFYKLNLTENQCEIAYNSYLNEMAIPKINNHDSELYDY